MDSSQCDPNLQIELSGVQIFAEYNYSNEIGILLQLVVKLWDC